jgi:hypothetical protein
MPKYILFVFFLSLPIFELAAVPCPTAFAAIAGLLEDPASSQLPIAFDNPVIRRLLKNLVPHMPVTAAERREMVTGVFGASVAGELSCQGSNRIFTLDLLKALGSGNQLSKKDAAGNFLLVQGLEAFRTKHPLPAIGTKNTPANLKPEIEQILASPGAGTLPIKFDDRNMRRLCKILTDTLPQDPEVRKLWVQSAVDEATASSIDYEGSPQTFAMRLIGALATSDSLNTKEAGSEYPLVNILFANTESH